MNQRKFQVLALVVASLMVLHVGNVRADDEAPKAGNALESPEAMDPAAYGDMLGRLGMKSDDFPTGEKPAAGDGNDGKNGSDGTEGKTAEEIAAEEEAARVAAEEAAAGAGGKTPEELEAEEVERKRLEVLADGHPEKLAAELSALGLAEEQLTAVQAILAKGPKAEEFEKAKTDLTTAQAEVTRLTAAVAAKPGAGVIKMHPTLLLGDLNALAQREQELAQFEDFCLKNWDGVAATEASADGKTAASPEFTAAQVRERYSQVKRERESTIPKVRAHLQWREQFNNTEVKKVYPELLDPKTPEYAIAQNMLAQIPGIGAVLPNILMIVGDALRGEKERVAKAKALAKPAAGKDGKNGSDGKPIAPKLPMSAAPARPAASAKAKVTGPDEKKFVAMGGTRQALVSMLEEMNLS